MYGIVGHVGDLEKDKSGSSPQVISKRQVKRQARQERRNRAKQDKIESKNKSTHESTDETIDQQIKTCSFPTIDHSIPSSKRSAEQEQRLRRVLSLVVSNSSGRMHISETDGKETHTYAFLRPKFELYMKRDGPLRFMRFHSRLDLPHLFGNELAIHSLNTFTKNVFILFFEKNVAQPRSADNPYHKLCLHLGITPDMELRVDVEMFLDDEAGKEGTDDTVAKAMADPDFLDGIYGKKDGATAKETASISTFEEEVD